MCIRDSLEVALGVVALRKDLGKRRLAAPDVSGYGYVHGSIGVILRFSFVFRSPKRISRRLRPRFTSLTPPG